MMKEVSRERGESLFYISRHITGFSCLLSAVFGMLGLTPQAFALEPLRAPTQSLSQRTTLSLEDYAATMLHMSLEALTIAASDLNGDGTDEFILHNTSCLKKADFCDFHVLAETKDAMIPLGVLKGKRLLLGNAFSHGIRNILAFEDATNDYDYTLYVWNPEKTSYEKKAHDASQQP